MITGKQVSVSDDGFVYLNLDSDYKSLRRIGKIESRVFHITKHKDKHLMRCNNSIGFNRELFEDFDCFDLVCLTLDGAKIWTSRLLMLSRGTNMFFQKNKLERQIFLRLEYFKASRHEALEEMHQLSNPPGNTREDDSLQFGLFQEVA